MKLKKLVAAAMAVVMSLAVLTGCSGGGSGAALITPVDCKAYTIEMTSKEVRVNGEVQPTGEKIKEYTTTDGDWKYYQVSGSKYFHLEDIKGKKEYSFNPETKYYMVQVLQDSGTALPANVEIKTSSEVYNGVSYNTKSYEVTEDGVKMSGTFLFNGNTLKYYKLAETGQDDNGKTQTYEEYYEVSVFKTTADAEKLSLGKYEQDGYTKTEDRWAFIGGTSGK